MRREDLVRLQQLGDASDPYAHLETDPFADMTDAERSKLHASLRQGEEEIAAGKSIRADELLRELRAARRR